MRNRAHPARIRTSLAVSALTLTALALSGCTGGNTDNASTPTTQPTSGSAATSTVPDEGDALFILDNDWSLYSGGDALILLADPGITLLGTTAATGDAWAPQGTAAALSFLEKIGKTDVPVAEGQTYPLINTPARSYARAALYGGQGAWLGAFAPSESDPTVPAIADPAEVSEPLTGWATSLAADELDAADFLIQQVHAHPGEVTIVTTGPLTNVAAAIRRDPSFASTAKGIVIGGGNLYQLSPGETDPGFNSSEGFNFRFDPESAHIALTADWASITAIGDATSSVLFDDALMDRIKKVSTPASEFIQKVGYVGYPIWDETTAAIAADPSLITQSIRLRMDVDIGEGSNYGSTRVWADGESPGLGEALVTYAQSVDSRRIAELFEESTRAKL